MPAIGWYNGTIGKLDEMTVPMNDRAVYFGDGCYEACLAVGGRAFALERHLDRFYRSLAALSILFTMDRDALKTALDTCLAAANEPCAVLYWQVSRATAPRTHAFPEGDLMPNLLITVTPKTLLPAERTLRLITVPDVRYALCHIKTLNLIPNVLASEQARAGGADEAVFVRDGFVTEGAHTNVHVLKDGTLYTHPANERILPGVTRSILLAICERLNVPVRETAFSKGALFSADEVLITSSTLGIRRAQTVDGVPAGGGADALYRAILQAYEQIFQEDIRQ
mgnify:CR=1 FL=1